MEDRNTRIWKLKAEVLKLYNRMVPTREIAKQLAITPAEAAMIVRRTFFDRIYINNQNEIRTKELRREREVYTKLNHYQGRNVGFQVEWM